MSTLWLVRDVLDAQLCDRCQEKIGRVDGLLLELRDDRRPRVATIVIGGEERAVRIGRWMTWLRERMGALTRRRADTVSRIPFAAVRRIADTIELDVDGSTLASGHLERWLVERIVSRIPGGSGGERK